MKYKIIRSNEWSEPTNDARFNHLLVAQSLKDDGCYLIIVNAKFFDVQTRRYKVYRDGRFVYEQPEKIFRIGR